jgi:hypothetical protein
MYDGQLGINMFQRHFDNYFRSNQFKSDEFKSPPPAIVGFLDQDYLLYGTTALEEL